MTDNAGDDVHACVTFGLAEEMAMEVHLGAGRKGAWVEQGGGNAA